MASYGRQSARHGGHSCRASTNDLYRHSTKPLIIQPRKWSAIGIRRNDTPASRCVIDTGRQGDAQCRR
jgi:hypothetical protein